jgi:hypothetical protein
MAPTFDLGPPPTFIGLVFLLLLQQYHLNLRGPQIHSSRDWQTGPACHSLYLLPPPGGQGVSPRNGC